MRTVEQFLRVLYSNIYRLDVEWVAKCDKCGACAPQARMQKNELPRARIVRSHSAFTLRAPALCEKHQYYSAIVVYTAKTPEPDATCVVWTWSRKSPEGLVALTDALASAVGSHAPRGEAPLYLNKVEGAWALGEHPRCCPRLSFPYSLIISSSCLHSF